MLNTYGMPGSIDTPAEVFPEGQFSFILYFWWHNQNKPFFQITNSVTVGFRYSRIPSATGDYGGYFWDRSFDLHYLLKRNKLSPFDSNSFVVHWYRTLYR